MNYHDEIMNFPLNDRKSGPIQYKFGFRDARHAAAEIAIAADEEIARLKDELVALLKFECLAEEYGLSIFADMEEMQTENNEQARLLGISAEHELSLRTKLEQSRAECEQLRKDAEIGAAINRACGVLPEGYHIAIWLEKDSGDVELQCHDFQLSRNDFEHESDTFGGQINAAINAAIDQQEKCDVSKA